MRTSNEKHTRLKFFLFNLQTKATKADPDPDLSAVAPIDAHAADAAAEHTRFHLDTAHQTKTLRSAQEARSVQIKRQFIKNMPGWLGYVHGCPAT